MSKTVRYKHDLDNLPPLTAEQKAELKHLRERPDGRIDTSDIPEVTDWSNFRRGRFYKPVKQQVSIRLDADVLDWFRTHASGRGYQTEINHVLREHFLRELKAQRRRAAAVE